MFKLLKKLKKIDWVLLGISVILIVASVYVDLLIPDYMKEITTIISESGEVKSVVLTGLKMLGCCLGGTALTILSGFITSFVSSDLSYNVRKELFDHVIDLDSQTVDNFQTASLITRTTNDITQIQMFMSMGLTMLIKSPVLAVWAILKIVNKSFQLSLVTLVAVILVLTMIITITSLVLPRFRKVQKLTDEVNKVARENLTGLKVVRAFNAEKYEEEKFDKVKNQTFYRCLGGGIEFLEKSSDALKREFKEEINVDISVNKLLGICENIFTYEGKNAHELILFYSIDIADSDYKDEYNIIDRGGEFSAKWIDIDDFKNKSKILYPEEVFKYL